MHVSSVLAAALAMRGGVSADETPTRSPTMSFAPTLTVSPSFAPTGVPLCEPQCEYDCAAVGRGSRTWRSACRARRRRGVSGSSSARGGPPWC